jgi:hypothetical protein
MKPVIFTLLFCIFAQSQAFAQSDRCFSVDTVYSTAKFRNLSNRDIRFGVKQMTEELISEKFCIKPGSSSIKVEIFYFGLPRKELRLLGVGKEEAITQIGIRLYVGDKAYEGFGESETEIRTVMLEVVDEQVPFSKMTLSNSVKKALVQCVSQL